ncbi:hypothetical protein J6590_099694 [Homalodisca vitripennis]|nr:hypothetical protein J6590_099694 [Homalodisca vitripennis]
MTMSSLVVGSSEQSRRRGLQVAAVSYLNRCALVDLGSDRQGVVPSRSLAANLQQLRNGGVWTSRAYIGNHETTPNSTLLVSQRINFECGFPESKAAIYAIDSDKEDIFSFFSSGRFTQTKH